MPYLVNWMNQYSPTKPLEAIDILPSKYTEVKKRYWSAIKTNETPTQKPTFTDLKQIISDWIRSQS